MLKKLQTHTFWLVASLLVAAFWVYLWSLAVEMRVMPAVVLPAPQRVWISLIKGLENGRLVHMMLETIYRMLYGWLLASLAGIALGCAIGMSPKLKLLLNPMLEFLRPIPAAAMLPIGLAFFGLTDSMVLFCIAAAAIWPTLLSAVHGFASQEERLKELSVVLGFSWRQTFIKISLPAALPDIFSGIRLSLTISLIVACLAEWIVSKPGVGQFIFLASQNFRAPDVFAGIILISVISLTTTTLLSVIELRVLRWKKLN